MLRARRAACLRASALLRRGLKCIGIDRSSPKRNRRPLPLPIWQRVARAGRQADPYRAAGGAEKANETGPSYKKGEGAGRRQKTGTEKDGRKTPQAEAG